MVSLHPTTVDAITWTLGGVASLCVGTRAFVRFIFWPWHGWDDYTMITTWLLAIISASLYTVERYELGSTYDKTIPELTTHAWNVSSASSLSILSVALGKISVVILLNRLIGPLAIKFHFYVLWATVLFAFVTAIANASVIWRSCVPLIATYRDDIEGSCINSQLHLGISMTQATSSALSDFVLATYSVWVFWSVNIPLLRKIGLSIVMGAGIFGVMITGIKAYELQHILTGSYAYINLWNIIEMFVLIIIACVPALRSLFRSRDRAGQGNNSNENMSVNISLECLSYKDGTSHPSIRMRDRNKSPHPGGA